MSLKQGTAPDRRLTAQQRTDFGEADIKVALTPIDGPSVACDKLSAPALYLRRDDDFRRVRVELLAASDVLAVLARPSVECDLARDRHSEGTSGLGEGGLIQVRLILYRDAPEVEGQAKANSYGGAPDGVGEVEDLESELRVQASVSASTGLQKLEHLQKRPEIGTADRQPRCRPRWIGSDTAKRDRTPRWWTAQADQSWGSRKTVHRRKMGTVRWKWMPNEIWYE